jgi:uncharacterized small protein (DUF1192 family)
MVNPNAPSLFQCAPQRPDAGLRRHPHPVFPFGRFACRIGGACYATGASFAAGSCFEERIMSSSSSLSLAELEQRIAIARDNIRQLIEQAAAVSGAEDEDRNADRIAQQNEALERLVKQRDALLKK